MPELPPLSPTVALLTVARKRDHALAESLKPLGLSSRRYGLLAHIGGASGIAVQKAHATVAVPVELLSLIHVRDHQFARNQCQGHRATSLKHDFGQGFCSRYQRQRGRDECLHVHVHVRALRNGDRRRLALYENFGRELRIRAVLTTGLTGQDKDSARLTAAEPNHEAEV